MWYLHYWVLSLKNIHFHISGLGALNKHATSAGIFEKIKPTHFVIHKAKNPRRHQKQTLPLTTHHYRYSPQGKDQARAIIKSPK